MRHSLRVERDGAVGQIVLLGPGQGNAMGPSTWSELPAAFDELEADAAIRAVVISGHGEHFSLRYAQSGARFSLREVRLAIVADLGGLARLPAIVGEGHARELALTGADIDAEHAARIGLVNAVVPEVIAHAVDVARSIAVHAPLTVAGIKNVMNAQQGKSIADGLQYVAAWNAAFLQSEDFARAAAAFRRST